MSSGSSTTILCNQENFLLKANGYIIRQTLPDHHILFKPAEKDYLEGRPKNGMFIAIPDVMKVNVADIPPCHWRIQAALIKKNNSKIMIINSYFRSSIRRAYRRNQQPVSELPVWWRDLDGIH